MSKEDLSRYSYEKLIELKNLLPALIEEKKLLELESLKAQYDSLARSKGLTLESVIEFLAGNQQGESKRKKTRPSSIQYVNPSDPSAVWSGRGRKPLWVVELVKTGFDLEKIKKSI